MIKKLIKSSVLFPYIKKIYTVIQQKKVSLYNHRAKTKLSSNGYKGLQLLGSGKDGIVFKGKMRSGEYQIVKVLSKYATAFLPITYDIKDKTQAIQEFYTFEVINNERIIYNDENLTHIGHTTIKGFAENFLTVCDIEINLLSQGLLIWDFGYSAPNYMFTPGGKLRWVDYGGNGFLYLNHGNAPIKPPRKNLVYANPDFVRLSVLLHWVRFALGYKEAIKVISKLQDARISFTEAYGFTKRYMDGTGASPLLQLQTIDLLSAEGWLTLKSIITQEIINSSSMQTLESADIESIDYKDNEVLVLGYQNYQIKNNSLEALMRGHTWATSKKKWEVVQTILNDVREVKSYLDIGSNLGMYVFSAHLNQGFDAYGIDYHPDYVTSCKKIANHFNLSCDFSIGQFKDISISVDCVTALGIVHHLYQRTENYNALLPIFIKFSQITKKYLIIEFPNENDSKAAKWTNMTPSDSLEKYSEEAFLDASSHQFKLVSKYRGITHERPIYLFQKLDGENE